MDFFSARDFIIASTNRFLKPDKSGKGFICPICGSGSGKNGTGITTKDGIHYTCWRGCYQSKDIIDIIGLQYGLTSYREKLEKACEELGLSLESFDNSQVPRSQQGVSWKNKERAEKETPESFAPMGDYQEFYSQCSENLKNTDYLLKRGISFEVQQKFGIGYCHEWQSPTALKKGYKEIEHVNLKLRISIKLICYTFWH